MDKEKIIKVLIDRANYFASKNHGYEAEELSIAIDKIQTLVPPEDFQQEQLKPTKIKSAKEVAIWHGLDCHPELEDCIKAMTEFSNERVKEVLGEVKEQLKELKDDQHKNWLEAKDKHEQNQYACINLGITMSLEVVNNKLKG